MDPWIVEFLFQKELVSGVIDTHVQQIWCHALMASRRRSNAQSKVTPHIPGSHRSIHACIHLLHEFMHTYIHTYIHTSYTPSTIQFLAAPKTSVVLFIYRHRVLPSSRARLIAKSRKNPLLAIFASLSLFESSGVEWSGVESFWVEGRKTPSAATTTKQQKQQQQQTRRQTQDEAKKKLNVEIGHV